LLEPDRDRPIDSFAAKMSPRVRIGYATSAASIGAAVRCRRRALTDPEEIVYPFLVNVPLTIDETYTPDIVDLNVRAALHVEALVFIGNKFIRVTLRGIGRGRTRLGDEVFPFTADANNPAGVLPAAGSIIFVPMFFDMVISCVVAGGSPEGQMYTSDTNLPTIVRDVFAELEQLTPGSGPYAHLTMGIVDAPQGLRLYPMRLGQDDVPPGWATDPAGTSLPLLGNYSIAARTYLEYQISDSPIYNYLPSTTALSLYSSFDSIPDWVYGGQGVETYRCGRIPQAVLGHGAPTYATSCRILGSRVFGRWSITRNSCGHNNGAAITDNDQGDANDWRGYEDMTYTSYDAITDKFRFPDQFDVLAIPGIPDATPGSLVSFEDRTVTYQGYRAGLTHPTDIECAEQLYTPSIAVHSTTKVINNITFKVVAYGTAPNDPTPRRPLIRWNLQGRVDRDVYCVRRYDTGLTASDLGITRPYPELYRGRFIEEAEQGQSDLGTIFAIDRRAYAYANLLHDVELTGGLVASNLHTPTDVTDMTTLAETIADTIEQHVFYLQASRPIANLTAHDALFDPAALPMVQDRYAASVDSTALLSDARVIPDALGRGLLPTQVLPAAQQGVGVGGIVLGVDYTNGGPTIPTTSIAFLVRVDRAALAKKLQDSQLTLRTQAVLSTCLRYTVI
ncbi:MAG: hypothetical protein ACO32I_06475, partial [Candidatus Limnocylindrus sp.]